MEASPKDREHPFTCRPATETDRDWWLAVRNDEDARLASRSARPIDPQVHARWFAAALADPREHLYVVEWKGIPAGQLRLTERAPQNAGDRIGMEISFAVDPAMRGRGTAREFVRQSKLLSRTLCPGGRLFAEIREENRGTRHVFQDGTFQERAAGEPGLMLYTWDIPGV